MESNNKGSASTSKSTDPFIRIDSLSINLPSSKSMNKMASCEHFSMRKYVSEMRQKDQTSCWPFEFGSSRNDATEVPIHNLPPLDVPKFRWWKCQNCLLEPVTEIAGTVQKTENCKCKSGSTCTHEITDSEPVTEIAGTVQKTVNCKCKSGSTCTHDITDSETSDLVTKFKHMVSLDMAEIRKHDDATVSAKANGNKLHALIPSQGEDKDHGIENLLKVPEKEAGHQDLPSPDGIPTQVHGLSGQEQGMDAKVGDPSNQNDYLGPNKQLSGNLEVDSIKHSTEDLQIQVKASFSDQQMKLVRSCQALDTVNTVTIENEQKHCEELDVHDPPSSDSTEICPSSRDKSGKLQRRKVRKVRLMTDLLGEKGNANAEHSRTRDSPLKLAVLDRSEEVGTTETVKKVLHAQKRKRNLPSDEDFKMEETVTPNMEFRKLEIVKDNATNTEALVGSTLDKDAFVKLSSDSPAKIDWMKYRSVGSNGIHKKKLKKKENNNQIVEQSFQIKESDLSKNAPLAVVGSFVENDASRRPIATTIVRVDKSKVGDDFAASEKEKKKKKNEAFHLKVGEPRFKAVSNQNGLLPQEDDGFLRGENESLFNSELKKGSKSCVCKKKSKVPHVDAYCQFTSRIPLVACKTKASGDTRKEDSGTVQIGSAATQLPNDARLRNGIDPPLVGLQFSTQVECGLSREESVPKEDQLLKKSIKFRYPEPNVLSTSGSSDPLRKGLHADNERKRATYGIPLMYEKQAYVSQSKDDTRSVMLQKDAQGASTKENIGSQNREAVKSRLGNEVADEAAPAPITSDDIPMDIVELMAKIQHDNRLYDATKTKKKLNSSLHKPSTSKEQHHQKMTKLGKQKMVSFSSQVTTSQMSTNPSAEKTHISKSRGAFTLYQEVCDSVPVKHGSSGATDNVKDAVGPWSSAMFMNSPQERVRILDFKSAKPEKKKHKKELHLEPPSCYPPRKNGSNLQNQFGPPVDFYSNEKITALHLLSLMDAGRKSGQSSSSSGAPWSAKQQQPPIPHGHHSKQSGGYPLAFAGMNFSVHDNASMDSHSLSATRDGNSSSWLLQTDEIIRKGSGVPPPQSLNQFKARDKGKRKLEGSSYAAQKSLPPVQNLQRKSDNALLNPMIFHTGGKKKLKSNNTVVDWPPRNSSETEICCTLNRNPADFSFPGPGNSYMIRGKEINYFSRKTTLGHCSENSGRDTKRQLTAAALLAEASDSVTVAYVV